MPSRSRSPRHAYGGGSVRAVKPTGSRKPPAWPIFTVLLSTVTVHLVLVHVDDDLGRARPAPHLRRQGRAVQHAVHEDDIRVPDLQAGRGACAQAHARNTRKTCGKQTQRTHTDTHIHTTHTYTRHNMLRIPPRLARGGRSQIPPSTRRRRAQNPQAGLCLGGRSGVGLRVLVRAG